MTSDVKDRKPPASVKVSVIMAAYNAEAFIEEAVASILEQSFTDFEFLIVDDASTDKTSSILNRIKDPRVQILQNIENIGLTRSLNRCLAIAQGEYIARQDADDVSLVSRFDKQVAFLEQNPDYCVVGSAVQYIDAQSKLGAVSARPEGDAELKYFSLYFSPFTHSSVMVRKTAIDLVGGGYNEEYKVAQDFELWSRMRSAGKFHNLPEVLHLYRVSEKMISKTRRSSQIENHIAIGASLIEAQTNDVEFTSLYAAIVRNFLEYADNKILLSIFTFNKLMKFSVQYSKQEANGISFWRCLMINSELVFNYLVRIKPGKSGVLNLLGMSVISCFIFNISLAARLPSLITRRFRIKW